MVSGFFDFGDDALLDVLGSGVAFHPCKEGGLGERVSPGSDVVQELPKVTVLHERPWLGPLVPFDATHSCVHVGNSR